METVEVFRGLQGSGLIHTVEDSNPALPRIRV